MARSWYILLCVCVALLADVSVCVADVMAKRWVDGGPAHNLYGAFLYYAACSSLWLLFLRLNLDLGRATVLWGASGTVIALLIGRFKFGETVSTVQVFGVVLCLAGVALVARK